MTRDELTKTLQGLGVTALELYDEIQRDPKGSQARMGKASALRRLLSVYQADTRLKLKQLKLAHKEAA